MLYVFAVLAIAATIAAVLVTYENVILRDQNKQLTQLIQIANGMSEEACERTAMIRHAARPIVLKINAVGEAEDWSNGPETSVTYAWHEIEELAKAVPNVEG